MQKQYLTALDVTDERQRGEFPPWQSKCANRTATLSDISVLVFVWVSVGCCFLRFSDYFLVIYGFSIAIHTRINHHFSRFFRMLASGPCTVASGAILANFSTITQSSSYATDYSYAK